MGTAHRPNEQPNIEIWAREPKPLNGTMSGALLASVCSKGFFRATGLQLQPGDIKKVRFSVEAWV